MSRVREGDVSAEAQSDPSDQTQRTVAGLELDRHGVQSHLSTEHALCLWAG